MTESELEQLHEQQLKLVEIAFEFWILGSLKANEIN